MFVVFPLTIIVIVAYTFYKWATLHNNFFRKRNVKFVKPTFLLGSSATNFSKEITATDYARILYDAFPDEPIYGMFDFREPIFVVRDPEVMKQICIRDFDHFQDHREIVDPDADVTAGNTIFLLKGEKWRHMRATLSPAFTGTRMRQLFELITECAGDLVDHLKEQIADEQKLNVEMNDLFTRYSNDVISTSAFGIKVNSFVDRTNEVYMKGTQLLDFSGYWTLIRALLIVTIPRITRLLSLTLFDSTALRGFRHMISDTMNVRQRENIVRPDLINMFLQIREAQKKSRNDENANGTNGSVASAEKSHDGGKAVNRQWTDDELIGQCFFFFMAGYKTTSTTLGFITYELIRNPDMQQRLYEEIVATNNVLNGKPLTLDVIQKMTYLDQFVCETFRKWPPLTIIDRLCIKDYVYDDGHNKFSVPKGTAFLFNVYGIQNDPKYFENPEKFDPERFSKKNKHKIIPGTYNPFGMGPRYCVGTRFSMMTVKTIVYYMLLHFKFEHSEQTETSFKLKSYPIRAHIIDELNLAIRPR